MKLQRQLPTRLVQRRKIFIKSSLSHWLHQHFLVLVPYSCYFGLVSIFKNKDWTQLVWTFSVVPSNVFFQNVIFTKKGDPTTLTPSQHTAPTLVAPCFFLIYSDFSFLNVEFKIFQLKRNLKLNCLTEELYFSHREFRFITQSSLLPYFYASSNYKWQCSSCLPLNSVCERMSEQHQLETFLSKLQSQKFNPTLVQEFLRFVRENHLRQSVHVVKYGSELLKICPSQLGDSSNTKSLF